MSSAEQHTNNDHPQTADRSPTEGFIRDLYALAAFYTQFPEHPRPEAVYVQHFASADTIRAIAAASGVTPYGIMHTADGMVGRLQADYVLPNTRVRMMVREPLSALDEEGRS